MCDARRCSTLSLPSKVSPEAQVSCVCQRRQDIQVWVPPAQGSLQKEEASSCWTLRTLPEWVFFYNIIIWSKQLLEYRRFSVAQSRYIDVNYTCLVYLKESNYITKYIFLPFKFSITFKVILPQSWKIN